MIYDCDSDCDCECDFDCDCDCDEVPLPLSSGSYRQQAPQVHRTHTRVFGTHFPPVMRNWHLDDWISAVYGRFACWFAADAGTELMLLAGSTRFRRTMCLSRFACDARRVLRDGVCIVTNTAEHEFVWDALQRMHR